MRKDEHVPHEIPLQQGLPPGEGQAPAARTVEVESPRAPRPRPLLPPFGRPQSVTASDRQASAQRPHDRHRLRSRATPARRPAAGAPRAGRRAAHSPQPVHLSGKTMSSGRGDWDSGLWHQGQRRLHPFRKIVVRMPGPIMCRETLDVENHAPAHRIPAPRRTGDTIRICARRGRARTPTARRMPTMGARNRRIAMGRVRLGCHRHRFGGA